MEKKKDLLKVLPTRFHMNGSFDKDIHTFGLYPHTQNLNHLLPQHNKQYQKESTAQ